MFRSKERSAAGNTYEGWYPLELWLERGDQKASQDDQIVGAILADPSHTYEEPWLLAADQPR